MNLSAIACLISLHGSGEAALAATPNSTGTSDSIQSD